MLIRTEEKKDWASVYEVIVLGHPECYLRFGFAPSTRFGIFCEYEVPEEAFMLLELHPGYLRSASGKVEYHAAFKNV